MSGATSALYEPLIERDLDAIPIAANAFLESHSEEELWLAIARFAVLAYAPTQHAKRAVMAVRYARAVASATSPAPVASVPHASSPVVSSRAKSRDPLHPGDARATGGDPSTALGMTPERALTATTTGGDPSTALGMTLERALTAPTTAGDPSTSLGMTRERALTATTTGGDPSTALGMTLKWALPSTTPLVAFTLECARYAAESRLPWSEPPLLEPPAPDHAISLQDALATRDRVQCERWLSAHLDDAEGALREVARGDALLMLDTALALQAQLGEKGRYALLRMVIGELLTQSDHPAEALETLVDRAIASNGAIDDVRAVFIASVGLPALREAVPLGPYRFARDYAQTLIAHAVARTLPSRADEFLRAVHHNLEHGESFAEWSFA